MNRFVLLILLALCATTATAHAQSGDAERGAYVLRLGGCVACHTVPDGGAFLAGGRELKTPFGSFFTPNITPDPQTGIGGWSEADFFRAMREGIAPDGGHYYPAFPYTSYTRMTDVDLRDLKAYLDSVDPVTNEVQKHDLGFPFNIRLGMWGWKLLFFTEERFKPDPSHSERWNRGAYIVEGPGHCGECHTPRGLLGNLKTAPAMAGNPDGPDGGPVPNITPHPPGGIGDWSQDDIVFALQVGILPDGDVVGGAMSDVVEDSTGKLTDGDLAAIAEYLLSLPPPR